MIFRIGVVGYSAQKFEKEKANKLLVKGLNKLASSAIDDAEIHLVSGLTDLGIPALAYRLAAYAHWPTVGIACARAEEYDCFPVDRKVIVGKEWGEESDTFLAEIDCLLRVGGGKQSIEEARKFQDLNPEAIVLEYELEAYK